MREVVIDEGAYRSADQVHAHLKGALSLPEYYGANLSALADCLEDAEMAQGHKQFLFISSEEQFN